jgi:hypothetical protein
MENIMMEPDKRSLRKLKRLVKRAGSKKRRQSLKHSLADHPEDAHRDEAGFGRASSETMNGMDKDSTRRRDG